VSKASVLRDKSLTFAICEAYAKGKTFTNIAETKGIHREQVKREVIKGLNWFLENYEEPEETVEGKKNYTLRLGVYLAKEPFLGCHASQSYGGERGYG
jgi:hypothetical protein